MSLSPIEKKTYYFPWAELPKESIKAKSAFRLAKSERFINIEKESKEYQAQKSEFIIPLSFDLFKVDWLKDHEMKMEKTTSEFEVKNPNYGIVKNDGNFSSGEKNQFAIQNIKKDVYIEEAFFILNDLIQTPK